MNSTPASAYMDEQVRRRAGSMSDVDWREMDETDRWVGFSDEELRELQAGAIDRRDGSKAVPAEFRERAGRLATELRKELKRREQERPSYRGPGRYRHRGGDVYEVLGRTPDGAERTLVILRRPSDAPGWLLSEEAADFEDTFSGQRRYEYLGPLPSAETVPVEIKLVEAGQGWAAVETSLGQRARLDRGDSLTVPALVIS